jgi:hypothetical protein
MSNDRQAWSGWGVTRKSKLTVWEVMVVSPVVPKYLKWYEFPITFNQRDYMNFIIKPGRYPLIVNPIVKDVKFN